MYDMWCSEFEREDESLSVHVGSHRVFGMLCASVAFVFEMTCLALLQGSETVNPLV